MDILPNDNDTKTKVTKKIKCSYKLRNLRQCLMYKPQILKLILKMRQCIRKKNVILIRLKKQLKLLTNIEVVTSYAQTDDITSFDLVKRQISEELAPIGGQKATVNNVFTQTEDILVYDKITKQELCLKGKVNESEPAWNINKEGADKEKSIAEQVEEVAQSALRETGMVYVDSAGMYYDYKTGYYYNSELGLYYHTDTGCYYYYSDEKQNFVFHSYPDRSAEIANASLIMHEKKKAKKHKKAMKSNIDNLTKTFSQEKEEDDSAESSKPKRKKNSHKKIEEDKCNTTINQNIDLETKKNVENNKVEKLVKVESSVKEVEKEEGKVEKAEMEDGECSETDCEEETDKDNKEDSDSNSTLTDTDDESVAKHHPPWMRLIVRESNLQKLKVGSLFLITKDGGSIGREGDQHAIVISDNNVSRNHLDIRYNLERNVYLATDLGSKNGTILNGIRMSESQDISEPMEVIHGSVIQLGETKLLCHIHPGNDTCGHCEPGLIIESEEKERKVAYTRTCSIQKQHKLELARLKNKYAKQPLAIEAEPYNDRAQARREAVGSSHHAEKTQSSDLDTFIEPENKGFKLLEKMGWTKGEGLGKDNQGDKEPIPLVSNEGKTGLGTSSSAPAYHARTSNLGPATLRLATRTKMLQPPAKVFQEQLDYDSE